MKKLIISVVFISIASICIFGQSSDKKLDKNNQARKEVRALAAEFVNALLKKDTAVLERILSDDYTEISIGGLPVSKELLLRFYKETANKTKTNWLDAFDIDLTDDRSISIYDNTAIIVSAANISFSNPAKKKLCTIAWVAIRQNGRWQLVLNQSAEVESQISPDPKVKTDK